MGISIDGYAAEHDAFRGRRGAHRRALTGIAALKEEGVRVGVRVSRSGGGGLGGAGEARSGLGRAAAGLDARGPLSEIWTHPPEELARLRRRSDHLTGRCAGCRFPGLCGGGPASRALASGAGLEGSDPGCHLRDEEIAAAA